MHNLNSPQVLSDAAFQQVQNTLINQARDSQLSLQHKASWEREHRMVWTESPLAVRTAIQARQAAIQSQQQRLEQLAKDIYMASLEALKRRYRERRDITGVEYDAGQRELHNQWQTRRVDLARRYVYTFADARLKEIQEEAYAAARAASDEAWEREGATLIESYAMPQPPSWATQSEHTGPIEKATGRRRPATAAR
jgi:hypothetical protein